MKRILFIIALAAILRFYNLGVNPPSLTWDEVAWGYNAYSLGIDGRDEHGRFLPINYLESFGDFKPPLYAYLDIIPVKIFGLNEFAVRFPSALFGVLTVLMTYFLTRRIFFSQDSPPRSRFARYRTVLGFATPRGWPNGLPRGETVALLSALFLAISPWHINLSRAGFEANIATFFIVLGVFLFLRAVSSNQSSLGSASFEPRVLNRIDTSGIFLGLSFISFALSMYTFNTARVVAPLLVVILSTGFWKRLWQMKKGVTIALIVGTIVMLPLLNFLLYPQASLRFREVNIFSDIGVINLTNQEIANDNNAWWSRILHNRRFVYVSEYLKHYFDHFKPKFLFISGDGNPKFSTQDVGSLYLWELPFFITGMLFLFRRKAPYRWLILFWMLIGVAPAATARETPHALRIETVLPTFQIFVAYGLFSVMKGIFNFQFSIFNEKAKYFKLFIVIFIFSLLFFNFAYYIHGYYIHYPREYSGEWQYGYKESVAFVKQNEQNFDEVKITTELGRPYIYYLFYTKKDPEFFRKNSAIERESFGFVNVQRVGKYSFHKDLNPKQNSGQKILYVDIKNKVPENAEILETFYLLSGNPALVAYIL